MTDWPSNSDNPNEEDVILYSVSTVSLKIQGSQIWESGEQSLHRQACATRSWPKASDLQVHKLKPIFGHLQKREVLLGQIILSLSLRIRFLS